MGRDIRILTLPLRLYQRFSNGFVLRFEHSRNADDAIHGRDGYDFDGCRLRVSYILFL